MQIELVRLDKTIKTVEWSGSVLDFLVANCMDFPHEIFDCPAECISMQSRISKDDKAKMMQEDLDSVTIVETPGDPFTIIAITLTVISIAAAVYVYKNMPDMDSGGPMGVQNILGQRSNRARPLERIEDVAGKKRIYPSLIGETYTKWESLKNEVEYSLLCATVGEAEFSDARDGNSVVSSIPGASAQVFAPFTMPGVDAPQASFGPTFNEPVKVVTRSSGINKPVTLDSGDELSYLRVSGLEPYYESGTGIGRIRSTDPDIILDVYTPGLIVDIAMVFNGVTGLINGTYEIATVSPDEITLTAPGGGDVNSVDSNWDDDPDTYRTTQEGNIKPSEGSGATTVGPFFFDSPTTSGFFVNVASPGLQRDDGASLTIRYDIEWAFADNAGQPTSAWTIVSQSLTGKSRNRIGKTTEVTLPQTGRILVRATRTTPPQEDVLSNVQLESVYAVEDLPVGVNNFGNVSTIQTRTASASAPAIESERVFNLVVSRRLPVLLGDGTFGPIAETDRFIDYMAYAFTSDTIGRRDLSELDGAAMVEDYNDMLAHFGSPDFGRFSYVFDTDQLSLQQILAIASNTCFCDTVRRYGLTGIRPDIPRTPKTMFNHRNKVYGEQKIGRIFNSETQKDGVELQYNDPDTDLVTTISLPLDGSAMRPEKIEAKGIRNHNQAWWSAWRAYLKMVKQRVNLDDTLTAEGALLSIGDVVAITNNTKVKPQSGDVIGINGTTLFLSEGVKFTSGAKHYIFLRRRDGSIQTIPCLPGLNDHQVVLDTVPDEPVYTEYEEEKTKFIFDADDEMGANLYVITEVDRSDLYEIPIKAVNYSEEVYMKDGEENPNV